MSDTGVVVAWHNRLQIESWLVEWGVEERDPRLVLTHDANRDGCAKTKNRGIQEAERLGFKRVVVLDDDCMPVSGTGSLGHFIEQHERALVPQEMPIMEIVTDPPSRGTPYMARTIFLEVAASMGFWIEVGDYDAPGQLVHGSTTRMEFERGCLFGRYFPMSGMNLAFDLDWWPWCTFIDVPRFDDIWMGWLWQKKAMLEGCCFNLNGPLVRHARQSNVWRNLKEEAQWLEENETLWQKIHESKAKDYDTLRALLPV